LQKKLSNVRIFTDTVHMSGSALFSAGQFHDLADTLRDIPFPGASGWQRRECETGVGCIRELPPVGRNKTSLFPRPEVQKRIRQGIFAWRSAGICVVHFPFAAKADLEQEIS